MLSSTLLIHTLVPLLLFGSPEAVTFQHLEHLFVYQAVITKRYRSITRDMGMRGFTVLLTATLLSKPIETLPDAPSKLNGYHVAFYRLQWLFIGHLQQNTPFLHETPTVSANRLPKKTRRL